MAIKKIFNGIDENGVVKTKELYFDLKNVLNEYEFYKQVNYLCYQSYGDKLMDKIDTKEIAIKKLQNSDSYTLEKAQKLNEELRDLEFTLEEWVGLKDNYDYPQQEVDTMSIIFAYAFCGVTANVNGVHSMVSRLRTFYNKNTTDKDYEEQKATLKTQILEFANSKIKTTDESGIFKNFKLDRINDRILSDIVATCASVGKWTKNGLYLDAKKDDAIIRELFKIILVCKYGACVPTAKKQTKTCRYSI